MKFRNLSLVIFCFFLIFLTFPKTSFAEATTTTPLPSYTCYFQKYTNPNIFAIIWASIMSLFSKPYDIDPNRPSDIKRQDMSNYGDVNSPEYKDKHSYTGSRLTANNTQNCLKGEIIKDVLLNQASDDIIGTICLKSDDSNENTACNNKQISNLAHFLLQTNQKFICENDNKIETPLDIINKINLLYPDPIPYYELPCYNGIYNDFFLTKPKPEDTDNDKNTIKIMKTPLPARYQKPGSQVTDLNKQNKLNFSSQRDIDANKAGLYLRPEYDK